MALNRSTLGGPGGGLSPKEIGVMPALGGAGGRYPSFVAESQHRRSITGFSIDSLHAA